MGGTYGNKRFIILVAIFAILIYDVYPEVDIFRRARWRDGDQWVARKW